MRAALAALLILLPAETASAGSRIRSLLEMRQDKVVVQQWDLSCGAAALATILTYSLGDPVSEKTVARAMLRETDPEKVKKRRGFSLLDLKRFAQSRGYEAVGLGKLELGDLARLAPAIVPLHATSANHFVVFRGFVGRDRVALSDPAWGNRTMPLDEFEGAWVERVAFDVKPRDGTSPPDQLTVRHEDWLLPEDR